MLNQRAGSKPLVFLSYRHDDPWSDMATRFEKKLRIVSSAKGFDVFIDKRMKSGVRWSEDIDEALAQTTHFIPFLCDDYWTSVECKREIVEVVRRYEDEHRRNRPSPNLLFVKAGEMDPKYFAFDEERQSGVLSVGDPLIDNLGVLNFLGPYDLKGIGKLETLEWEGGKRLDQQLQQLLTRFIETLEE